MIYYDFGFYMTVAAAITGGVALMDKLKWSKQRAEKGIEYHEDGREKMPAFIDISRSIFPVIFIILILRSFFYEPYRIPSGSMNPGLYDGDFILVNKFAYGVRLPITNTQIIPVSDPKRGDVIVFHPPKLDNPEEAIQPVYIKRLYGLPGDTISWNRGVLTITPDCSSKSNANNENCETVVIKPEFIAQKAPELVDQSQYDFSVYKQNVFGKEHELLFLAMPYANALNNQWSYKIPENKYFAMGDHRDNSVDIREWLRVNPNAFIDREAIIGRASVRWLFMSFTEKPVIWGKHLPNGISFDRVGAIK